VNLSHLLAELQRRNVYKVAVAYAVGAWLLIQLASILFPTFEAPAWVMKVFVVLVAAGFVMALMIAWSFEMTPEGMKRTEEIPHERPLPYWSRRKFGAFIVTLALLAAGLLAFQLLRPTGGKNETQRVTDVDKSIAVLPFDNFNRDPDNAYFADGIQDEILTRLAKIDDLKVISRTSTQRYKTSPENLPEIAKQLGVAHVLEGSVQKADDQVRVTVQLIRAATDSHVWAETYDRKLTDIFAVESEIAESIAKSLRARLTPGEKRAVMAKPTDNAEAYDAYLRRTRSLERDERVAGNIAASGGFLSSRGGAGPEFRARVGESLGRSDIHLRGVRSNNAAADRREARARYCKEIAAGAR